MNKFFAVLNVITFSSVLTLLAYVLTGGPQPSAPAGSPISSVDGRHQELVDRLAAVEMALQSVLASRTHNPAATQVMAEANAEPGTAHFNDQQTLYHQTAANSAQQIAARTLTDTIIQSGNMTAQQAIELRGALVQLQDRRQAQRLMKDIVIAINNDQLQMDPSASL